MNQIEFEYRAIANDGRIINGLKKSADEFSLQKELKIEGQTLLHAEPARKFSLHSIKRRILSIGAVSAHERIIFIRNLGAMLEAGLSMARALSVIERQSKNPKLKNIVKDLEEKIKKGDALSKSMKDYPAVFPPLVASMVEAGEESGNLVNSLYVVADQMEKQYLLSKKIKGAMVYPGVIISAMIIIGIFMMIYVVPTLTSTFSELNVQLPASTQFIIQLSDFMRENILLVIVILVVLIVGIVALAKNEKGKIAFHWFFLHLPVIKELVREINSARTARTLSSLLSAGVSFVRSIQITRDVIQNSYYKKVLEKAEKNVQLGLPISKIFSESEKLYPIFVSEMMAVGEETGELGPMLLKVADFFESEVDQKTKNLSTVIEPALMIIVGIAVGFFAISMISPMYSLVNNI